MEKSYSGEHGSIRCVELIDFRADRALPLAIMRSLTTSIGSGRETVRDIDVWFLILFVNSNHTTHE